MDLNSLDDRAKLANLIMPHVEQVPDGILKQLMLDRLHSQTGFAPRGRAQQGRRPGRSEQAPGQRKLPGLVARLVATLIQQPGLVERLSPEAVSELVADDYAGVLEDLVRYVLANPTADAPELLGRWVGHPFETELQQLAGRRFGLGADALAEDFTDGVGRYLAQRARAHRRTVLADLKDQPTAENLRRYWDLKQTETGGD